MFRHNLSQLSSDQCPLSSLNMISHNKLASWCADDRSEAVIIAALQCIDWALRPTLSCQIVLLIETYVKWGL